MRVVQPSHILGMNARSQLYTSLNSKKAKKYGFSKLRAKNFLKKHSILVPELYELISSREELRQFEWNKIPGAFAVKPANGSAGKGIVIIQRKKKNEDVWIDIDGNELTEQDLDLHVSDILDGRYSTWGAQHAAIIEERILVHPDLEPHVEMGTPDIRVILYRKIPVMAYARLPTFASQGRANLDKGAIALGIDFGTGKTTYGSGKKSPIQVVPKSGASPSGIQIPLWKQVLRTAVRVANATGYVFMGVDIFIDPQRGPMIAEVNGFPGLSIQIANRAGLRKRLERLEGMEALNVNHAVKIAQALFAENYPAQSFSDLDLVILEPKEEVTVFGDEEQTVELTALMNTGRYRSAISWKLAEELGLVDPDDQLWRQNTEEESRVPVVEVKFKLRERVMTGNVSVSKRLNHGPHQFEVGRRDLEGFLVKGER